jgi:hypothetical protein
MGELSLDLIILPPMLSNATFMGQMLFIKILPELLKVVWLNSV